MIYFQLCLWWFSIANARGTSTGSRLFQWVLTGRIKIDSEFNPEVGFGCSAYKVMGFLIQMKAGEISRRLGLRTLGTWGSLPGAGEECGLAALQGKVRRGAKRRSTASRDRQWLPRRGHSTQLRQAGLVRAARRSPATAGLPKATKGGGRALRCAGSKQSLSPGSQTSWRQDALRALPPGLVSTKLR